MENETKTWNLPVLWQMSWLVGFVVGLLATAFFGTFVGVAIQAAKWGLLAFTGPLFLLCAGGLYWLATRIRHIVLGNDSIILEAAAFEREIPFTDIEGIILFPKGRGWAVGIVCKEGGGYRLKARTRAWADTLSARARVPLQEPGE